MKVAFVLDLGCRIPVALADPHGTEVLGQIPTNPNRFSLYGTKTGRFVAVSRSGR
jgi:hypothetical protein